MSISIARMFGLAAVAAFAGTGLMEGAQQQGMFHLPMAAHWGSVTLQPGDYCVTLPDLSLGERTFRVTGDGKTILEMPIAIDLQKESKTSQLELWQIEGNYFVRGFSSAPAGKTFTFSVPKRHSAEEVAKLRTSSSMSSRSLP